MKKLLALVGVLALSVAANATVIYSTGFEAPEFTAGSSLVGQSGWQGDSVVAAQIQTTNVYSGTQAVGIDTSTLTSAWFWKVTPFDPVASGEPIVTVSTYMYMNDFGDVNNRSTTWGLDVYDSAVARSALIYVNDLDQVFVYDVEAATAVNTGLTIPRGVWAQLGLVMDYANDTYYGLVNGVPTVTVNLGSQLNFSDADLRVTGGWYDAAYFDDFSITATPEPASLLLVGLGLLLRRR